MGTKTIPIAVIAAATAKAQNAEYFAADLAPVLATADYASEFKISLSGTAVDVEYTLDSGTTWLKFGTLTAQTKTEYTVRVRTGDTFNMRTIAGAGITLDYLRVDEVR